MTNGLHATGSAGNGHGASRHGVNGHGAHGKEQPGTGGRRLALEAVGLVKQFGTTRALGGVDLAVDVGSIVGVLGVNGAGKTTLMRIISGVIRADEGRVVVGGLDLAAKRRVVKGKLGVVPQGMTLDFVLSARDALIVHGGFLGLKRKVAAERAEEALAFVELTEHADERTGMLSGGMQRRLLIARALLGRPEVLLLDEPTVGLDPQARHLLWDRLRQLRDEGVTVLITTHYMDEAAQLCDEIVVLDDGLVMDRGSPYELTARHACQRALQLEEALVAEVAALLEQEGHRVIELGRPVIHTDDEKAVLELLGERGIVATGRDTTLEDAFLVMTGRQVND